MIPHISSTTARDRLPVAVSFSPPVSAARRSRIRALAVNADPEISALARSGSRQIAWLLPEGSWRRAFRPLNSSIVQAGSTPLSHRRTSGFWRNPGATISGREPVLGFVLLPDRLCPAPIPQPPAISDRHHDQDLIGSRCIGDRDRDGIEMRE